MTHLSDFSYVDRGTQSSMIFLFVLWQIWRNDRFRSFHWVNFRRADLKTVIASAELCAYLLFIIYDMIAMDFKYEEGFYYNSETGEIKQMPSSMYSAESLYKVSVCGHLINCCFTLQSSALFLLIAYFNDIVKRSTSMKKHRAVSIMSQTEYKVYMVYSVISIILYPVLKEAIPNALMKVVGPQLVSHTENLACIYLLLLTNHRFQKVLQQVDPSGQRTSKVAERLSNVVLLNNYLCLIVFLQAFGLGSINIDILFLKFSSTVSPFIYVSKFNTDLFTCFFNLGWTFHIIPVIEILFPSQRRVGSKVMNRTVLSQSQQSSAAEDGAAGAGTACRGARKVVVVSRTTPKASARCDTSSSITDRVQFDPAAATNRTLTMTTEENEESWKLRPMKQNT